MEYWAALDAASAEERIEPFARFISTCVVASMPRQTAAGRPSAGIAPDIALLSRLDDTTLSADPSWF